MRRDSTGQTPLHWASKLGHSDIASCLLDHGVMIDNTNSEGLTPLQVALGDSERESVARVLVFRKTDLGITTPIGDSPLHLAAKTYWRPGSRLLEGLRHDEFMSVGPNFEENYNDGFIKFLVDNGASLEARNEEGQIPLLVACTLRMLFNTACILCSGADPNSQNRDGLSPLLVSVLDLNDFTSQCQLEIGRLLLKYGADPEAQTPEGNRALHLVCADPRKTPAMAGALLRHRADVNASNGAGLTLILVAMCTKRRREETVTQLVAAWASLEDRDETERTVLHLVCLTWDSYLVRRLLDWEANVSARDEDGNTPLHLIMERAKVDWGEEPWIEKMIRLLLLAGASIKATNEDGLTPAEMARRNRWTWLERDLPEFYPAGAEDGRTEDGAGEASICAGGGSE